MNKTKIDWADYSWNPITGCLHGCEYCYAQNIAHRFGMPQYDNDCHIYDGKVKNYNDAVHTGPFPWGFAPTFHKYRLKEPKSIKVPSNIFTVSMGDLFGSWVPLEWIHVVFDACEESRQHNYLFLTKNPAGIDRAIDEYTGEERGCSDCIECFKDFWFGTSITCQDDISRSHDLSKIEEGHRFLSIEPIRGPIRIFFQRERCPKCGSREVYEENRKTAQGNPPFYCDNCGEWEGDSDEELQPSIDWVIVGAETGNSKDRVIPEKDWIQSVVRACRAAEIPVFMKESLRFLMGAEFVQEFPEALKKKEEAL